MNEQTFQNEEFLDETAKLEKDNGQAFGDLARLFCHCLKWKHQPSYQEYSWVRSVKVAIKDLNKLVQRTNTRNYIIENISAAFDQGILDMVKETKILIADDQEARSEICFLTAVLSESYMKSWMSKYANPNKPDFLSKWIPT